MSYNISYTQISMFKECSYKWKLRYKDKIVPNWQRSALLIGTAIDNAVEAHALKTEDPFIVLEKWLSKFKLNNRIITLPEDLLLVRFSASDIQPELITNEYLPELNEFCDRLNIEPINLTNFLDFCKASKQSKQVLDKTNQKLLNFISWLSIKIKTKLILKSLIEWLDSNIVNYIDIQKKISISNAEGDTFNGILDMLVETKDGKTVLIDLKTSANAKGDYPEGCVENSFQLAIYAQEVEVVDAAYLVVDKKIRKRGNPVVVHYVHGVITESQLDTVFGEIDEVLSQIKTETYSKNNDSCFKYGKCEYFDYCHKNKSMVGLTSNKEPEL